jgi:signal transduction histidine kinase
MSATPARRRPAAGRASRSFDALNGVARPVFVMAAMRGREPELVFANTALRDATGLTDRELAARGLLAWLSADAERRLADAVLLALESGQAECRELDAEGVGAELRTVESGGRQYCVVTLVPKLTPEAIDKSHDELEHRAQLLATALDLVAMAAWSWNRRTDEVRTEYRATSGDAPRMPEKTMTRVIATVHPDDRARVAGLVQTALGTSETQRYEFRVLAQGGGERWFGSAIKRVLDSRGRPVGVVGATRDVTRERTITREIIEAANRERDRIGHDLHDGLGQELTGISLMLKGLLGRTGAERGALRRELGEVLGLVNDALQSTRSLARGLSPVAIERGGLAEGLRALLGRARETAGLKARLTLRQSGEPTLDSAVAMHLYRMAQESLGNAVRHAGATRVDVSLQQAPGQVRLRIADNGKGLPQRPEPSQGLGLRIMEYRAQLIGAGIDFGCRRSGGTSVVVTWPARHAHRLRS